MKAKHQPVLRRARPGFQVAGVALILAATACGDDAGTDGFATIDGFPPPVDHAVPNDGFPVIDGFPPIGDMSHD